MPHLSALHEVDEHLQGLHNRKSSLLNEIEHIERQIQLAQTRRATLYNDAAPISKLPHELLSSIFLMAREDYARGSPHLQVMTSHVSSRWRAVAISTPLLWTDIRVSLTLKNAKTPAALDSRRDGFVTYLTRSNSRPFNLRMECNGDFAIEPFLMALGTHMHRCSKLTFTISNHRHPALTLQNCLGLTEAPILEHLSIHIPDSRLYEYPKRQFSIIQPNLLETGAPALRFLRLTGMAGYLQPPLTLLRTLHLDGRSMDDLSFQQFRDILQSTPNLENLSLYQLWVTISPGAPITIPKLRSLRVRNVLEYNLLPLLATLPLPQLESCIMSQVIIFPPLECPNVKKLTLDDCSVVPGEVGNLIEAYPAIESLTISSGDPATIFFILGTPGNPIWWPRLKRLYLMDLPVRDVDLFVQKIRSRQATDSRLETLYLDRKSRGVLRLKHQLDEVKALVAVEKYEDTASWPTGLGFDDDDDGFWS
ncbi:hypothetical protein AAF712_007784 [Marasmius tenuissimus]|uniref:F-box domain-containing protein n=1 Tax=Marasmius tenuissimus TaxID=585030 RepID=A0ABR2ZW41_9AGAR